MLVKIPKEQHYSQKLQHSAVEFSALSNNFKNEHWLFQLLLLLRSLLQLELFLMILINIMICLFTNLYHKVVSINTSHLEPHPGIYRLLMKEKLDVYEV
mgnify:CR=1 FL=1